MANDEFPLPFQPAPVYAAYHEGRHEAVSEAFLRVLRHFRTVSYRFLNDEMRWLLDEFTKHFLHLFTQEDYVPSDAHIEEFIALNPVIANLVAISSFRTTDPHVRILKGQKHNFAKLLALYSARNSDPIDRRGLFEAQPGAQIPTEGVIYACVRMDTDDNEGKLARLVAASEPCSTTSIAARKRCLAKAQWASSM